MNEAGMPIMTIVAIILAAFVGGLIAVCDKYEKSLDKIRQNNLLYQKPGDTGWYPKMIDSSGRVYIPQDTENGAN